jgi:osmoprotectant transport system permease protein
MFAGFQSQFAEALARLPEYLGGHVAVSVTALMLGLAVSLPLAIVSMRRPALRRVLLGLASIVQTIPGLALLALFYPLLLGVAALSENWLGAGFSALGFLPSVLALALYSMLPVLRNTITGLMGIDPAVNEAAAGVGMTRRQALFMVELPLALPVIMAGIRTSAVWVIGTATLSTPIGQTSLGNYIFAGLQTQNWVFVLFGCVAAAGFALLVDQLLALMETGVARRRRARVAFGGAGLLLIVLAAALPGASEPRGKYVIGAKPFTEQYILAALIEQRLAAAGLSSTRREGLGSTVIFGALAAGEIDVYVDYSGTIWATQMRRSASRPRAEVLRDVSEWLSATHGISMLGGLGFENAYSLAIKRERAEALGIRSIADLAGHAGSLSIGGDYEFFVRPEWEAIRDAYGLSFREQRQMQSEFMYPAAASGDVDVIAAYTSDGRIAKFDLLVLDDPKRAIPPYDAVLLVAPGRRNDRALLDALQPLIGRIDVSKMRAANLRAAGSGADASPAAAARWLWNELAGSRPPAR